MKFRIRPQEELQVSLTPLIDVVFILLIFFMVTTTFDRNSELRIDLPEATAKEKPGSQDTLEIAIDAKGQFFVNQVRVISSTPKALYLAISKVVGNNKDMPVILKADGKTPHQFVVTAMDTIGRLGLTRLSIATNIAQ
jgi:biopolymer transport protein ExbD